MTSTEFLPILEAFVAGKPIEVFDILNEDLGWFILTNPNFADWDLTRYTFRIALPYTPAYDLPL